MTHPQSFLVIKRLTTVAVLLTIFGLLCLTVEYTHVLENHEPKDASSLDSGRENVNQKYDILRPRILCDPSAPQLFATQPQQRYLTYLPHSGFHNQRISLENAIFVAWYTNRTLVIPPIILGKKFPWTPPQILAKRLATLRSNKSLRECDLLMEERKKRCVSQYEKYTLLQWDELFDIAEFKNYVSVVPRTDFKLKNLQKMLGITDPDKDIYRPEEAARYDIRYFDNPSSTDTGKFARRADLCSLLGRSEKLIHFNSLYSTKRLSVEFPENIAFQEIVATNMVPTNKVLIGVTDEIVRQLGGLGSYDGIHLRVGDSGYKYYKLETVKQMVKTLKANGTIAGTGPHLEGTLVNRCERHDVSSNKTHPAFDNTLFVATDTTPDDPALAAVFSTFPCTFTLANFTEELEPLKNLRNPADDYPLSGSFIPFLDLMVASRGGKFYGTRGSTFSQYAKRMHALWIQNGDRGELIDLGHAY